MISNSQAKLEGEVHCPGGRKWNASSVGPKTLTDFWLASGQYVHIAAKFVNIWTRSLFIRPFEYSPLETPRHIRLCYLQPGGWDDSIQVILEHYSVDDLPPYQAISYAWGDDKIVEPIFCYDNNTLAESVIDCRSTTVDVTTNLAAAFRRLRAPKGQGERVLWADAICINQKDKLERNVQLPLMQEIYSRTARVICWIGEQAEDCALAFDFLSRWARAFDIPEKQAELALELSKQCQAPAQSAELRSLRNLIGRPWFRRAWVLQETFLPEYSIPHLHCGNLSLDFCKLLRAVYTMWNTDTAPIDIIAVFGVDIHYLLPMLAFFSGRSLNHLHLSQMIRAYSSHLSKDPKDKFYSLVGMMAAEGVVYPAPDYRLSFQQIVMQYTRAIIVQEKKLGALCVSRLPHTRSIRPTWALDPTLIEPSTPSWGCWTGIDYHFNAMLDSEPLLCHEQAADDPVLQLYGIHLDKIVRTHLWKTTRSEVKAWKPKWPAVLSFFAIQCAALQLDQQYAGTGEPMTIALLRTLAVDTYSAFSQRVDYYDLLPIFTRWVAPYALDEKLAGTGHAQDTASGGCTGRPRSVAELREALLDHFGPLVLTRTLEKLGTTAHSSDIATEPQDPWLEALEAMSIELLQVAMERWDFGDAQLVLTSKGYLGLAPMCARVGDDVCLLPGCTIPMILRALDQGNSFELIGQSYVHGFMRGEGMSLYNDLAARHPGQHAEEWLTRYCIV